MHRMKESRPYVTRVIETNDGTELNVDNVDFVSEGMWSTLIGLGSEPRARNFEILVTYGHRSER